MRSVHRQLDAAVLGNGGENCVISHAVHAEIVQNVGFRRDGFGIRNLRDDGTKLLCQCNQRFVLQGRELRGIRFERGNERDLARGEALF